MISDLLVSVVSRRVVPDLIISNPAGTEAEVEFKNIDTNMTTTSHSGNVTAAYYICCIWLHISCLLFRCTDDVHRDSLLMVQTVNSIFCRFL